MSAPALASQFTTSAGRFQLDVADPMAVTFVQAVSFAIFTVFSIVQLCRQRTWYFGIFTTAAALQTAGSAAQVYLAQAETDHLTYVVSFACLTLAPALLALSTITAYRRLHLSTAIVPYRMGYRTLYMPERAAGVFCTVVQLCAVIAFLFGIASLAAFHSPAPIQGREGALARLAYEAQAIIFLRVGWIIQMLSLAIFMISSSGPSVADHLDRQSRNPYWAINWVAWLNLTRTIWKLLDFTQNNPESLNLAGSSTVMCLIDGLPLLLAFGLFLQHWPAKIRTTSSAGLDLRTADRKLAPLLYETPSNC